MNYAEKLFEFKPAPSEDELAAEVARIKASARENDNTETWTQCLGSLDLTSLGNADSESSITDFVGRAVRSAIDYPHLPTVAAVCVFPSMVEAAGLALGNSGIALASVAGGFPASQTFIEVKMLEVAMAVESGADEIDIVINTGEMLDGEYDRMASTTAIIREELGGDTILKVIIESGTLKTPELIRDATLLAMLAGADFVKTSTGKAATAGCAVQNGATPEAAIVMCRAIRDYYEKTGRMVGFKAAGGIRTVAEAVMYHTIVREILGEEWLSPRLFRIGASSLANNLLSATEGKEIRYF
jgi:deoxyribose-phosphate aldolase